MSPRAAAAERARRWVRVHVARTQTRDLFYPCLAPAPAGGATVLRLERASRPPRDVHLNGRPAAVGDVARDDGGLLVTLAPGALVLPGENVVSVPAACGARAAGLSGPAPAGIGWGSFAPAAAGLPGDERLAAAAGFLLRSLSRDPLGPGLASLTACDPRAGAPRLWSWYWTTGIVYEALAALAAHRSGGGGSARGGEGAGGEAAGAGEPAGATAGLLAAALAGLEEGLRARQVPGGGGVDAGGSYLVRWDPDRAQPAGVQAWHAPNDAAYLGLHGLLVAHRRHGDEAWLDQARRLAGWVTGPGCRGTRLRVGWNATTGRWDDSWHYLDAAWTPAFLCALAAATGEEAWLARADALARDTIERFGTDGPFYLKIWRANGRHTRTVFARGMAWVLEGWVPLAQAGGTWLLPRLDALVRGLLDHQRPDGSWPYLLDQPGSGPCNKGTPALAYHLRRAAPLLPRVGDRIEEAAARALGWCDARLDLDPGSAGRGGIVAHNVEGAIATVRDIPVAVNYASAYYLLARLERGT